MKAISRKENAGMPLGGKTKRRLRMTKYLVLSLALVLTTGLLAQIPEAPKPSQDIQIRILRVQKDQLLQQQRLQQIAEAYNSTQDTLKHDSQEISSLQNEALKTAGLDAGKFTLDLEKLVFVPRPPAPAPSAGKAPDSPAPTPAPR